MASFAHDVSLVVNDPVKTGCCREKHHPCPGAEWTSSSRGHPRALLWNHRPVSGSHVSEWSSSCRGRPRGFLWNHMPVSGSHVSHSRFFNVSATPCFSSLALSPRSASLQGKLLLFFFPIPFGSSFFWFHYSFCGPLWQHVALSALTAPFPFRWPKEVAKTSKCQSSCKEKERTATGLTDFRAGVRKGIFVGLFHVDSRGGPICNLNIGHEGAIPTRLCSSTECRKICCVSYRNHYWLRTIQSCSCFVSVCLRTFRI